MTSTTYRLIDPVSRTSGVNFTPQADNTVLVTFWEYDDGDCETGPLGRSEVEKMDINDARKTYRDVLNEGWVRAA